MYSVGTGHYFDDLPELEGLGSAEARRLLTLAYTDVLAVRLELEVVGGRAPGEIASFLRRLGSTLETYAVFRESTPYEARQGAAFVAAEALNLLGGLLPADAPEGLVAEPRMVRGSFVGGIEAGLLYLAAGFDSNAEVVANRLLNTDRPSDASVDVVASEECADAFLALLRRDTRASPVAAATATATPVRISDRVRAAAFRRMAEAIYRYLGWIGGLHSEDPGAILVDIDGLVAVVGAVQSGRYADVRHLSQLLRWTIAATLPRALRKIAASPDPRYAKYIFGRARERPLLFPPAVAFAHACLPGPSRHAVVSLPMGGGKSFLAELAVSQAILEGWALYLVPTNALAAQVRRDLQAGLDHLPGSEVRAFLGDSQYTSLAADEISDVGVGQVLVMTPEKCALALRRDIGSFETLRLCVLDEAHILNEPNGRGMMAELVLAHILSVAPLCKVLLLSALIDDAEPAVTWLKEATGQDAVKVQESWRPTRNLRGVVGFDSGELQRAAAVARRRLAALSDRRKNMEFRCQYSALVNLQGAWTDLNTREYCVLKLRASGALGVHRWKDSNGEWHYQVSSKGYVNPTVAALAGRFAARGERVLAFVPRSRHDPFVVAGQIGGASGANLEAIEAGRDAAAFLLLAEYELGVASPLDELARSAVTVHSGALIDSERTAAEILFGRGVARIMVATGTLAQGLNLPATTVLIGGTQVGYEDASGEEAPIATRLQLLNAIGRAGRAGVENHSLSLVVPNAMVTFDARQLDPAEALMNAGLLAYDHAGAPLVGRFARIVERVDEHALTEDGMSSEEMVGLTYLPGGDRDRAEEIVMRTFALRGHDVGSRRQIARRIVDEVQRISVAIPGEGSPAWAPEVSYRSGVPLREVVALCSVAREWNGVKPDTLNEWVTYLFWLLRRMPVSVGRTVLGLESSREGLAFSSLWTDAPNAEAWTALEKMVTAYLGGATVLRVAEIAHGHEVTRDGRRNTGGQAVPRTISVLQGVSYNLSMFAGAVVAMWRAGSEATVDSDPAWRLSEDQVRNLGALPLALRSGCGTRDSLAWFRFAVRYRWAAHLLGGAMPVPDDLSDIGMRDWIRSRRQEIAEDEYQQFLVTDQPGVDAALKRVLGNG